MVKTFGEGQAKEAASEEACDTAFAVLLHHNPSHVVLRPKHWTLSLEDLFVGLPAGARGPGDAHQALPVFKRVDSEHQGKVGAAMTPQ